METRANYLLIGAFTLAGFLGLLGFLLWFARVELDRQFDYYDIVFPTVTGLSSASEVRFSGLPVGQVVDVALAPDRSGRVRVRVELDAATPVRTSSVATVETLGVTGQGYVSISSGDPGDPLLERASEADIPEIEAGRSVLQTLTADAPQILEEVLEVTRQVGEVLGPDNQRRVANILENVEDSSARLSQALDDVSSVTRTMAEATEDIGAFTARLEDISGSAQTTLETADDTLRDVGRLAERAEGTLETGDAALESGRRTFDRANAFLETELPGLVSELETTLAELRAEVGRVGDDAGATLAEFRRTGELATARLEEAEATIAAADRVLAEVSDSVAAVEAAATRLDRFVAEDGTALVAEARTFLANADEVARAAVTVAEEDLPAILADIRSATETAAATVESVGADLSAAAGRADAISAEAAETLDSVSATFESANATLERLNGAIATGDSALSAAEEAFTAADTVLREDAQEIVAGLRDTLDRLDAAIGAVAEDVPAITAQIRRTAERADATFAGVEGAAERLGPRLETFAEEGLPQYTRLAREGRELVDNLRQLVRQIERDPARYFLGREAPAYRR
jgi:phospholipid/cholesterol/gamma-HCH transport system substrate-binding protein